MTGRRKTEGVFKMIYKMLLGAAVVVAAVLASIK
jgi:hypothetical protein